jgi:PAS domain-containing protein
MYSLGAAFYRIRSRGLADAQAAIDSAEAAERAAEILAAERQRLSAVIEGTDVGIWDWDFATDLRTVDERWAKMIGYRQEELPIRSGPTQPATWLLASAVTSSCC